MERDDFILQPLLVFRPVNFVLVRDPRRKYALPLAQILMRRGVRLDIDSVVAHVGELLPRDRFAAAEMPPRTPSV